ncbi:MAG: 50S ribosomal protein L13 [Holosporales bacterium]|jgi:large subunit ribosomal protein L13
MAGKSELGEMVFLRIGYYDTLHKKTLTLPRLEHIYHFLIEYLPMKTAFVRTYSAKPQDNEKKWHLIDAEDLVVGRLSSYVAKVIRGKHKTIYTPHVDCGDGVIIINAEKVKITGDKLRQKIFFWHTGYIGGIKERTWKSTLEGKYPERVLLNAIKRMMPKESPLARQQLADNLRVYAGADHPHAGQNPTPLNDPALVRHWK